MSVECGCWDTGSILPPGFLPMRGTPVAAPPVAGSYAFALRREGVRLLVGLAGSKVEARLESGQSGARWLPPDGELRSAVAPSWTLLDVEIAPGPPSRGDPAPRSQALVLVGDILRIGDSWLLDVSWEERQRILARSVTPTDAIRIQPHWETLEEASVHARERAARGVVAKRLRGRYYPGEQTREWLLLRLQEESEVTIVGWLGAGKRSTRPGCLLVAVTRRGRLTFAGQVNSGLSRQGADLLSVELQALDTPLSPLEVPPSLAPAPRWVRPLLSCRVRHQGWNDDGTLRSPVYLGRTGAGTPSEGDEACCP